MAIQGDETLVTKGNLKELYQDKILPYLGGNMMMQTGVSNYYSEDEKIVGIWTNGKPLYQKVLTGSLTGTTTDFYSINHNISNIDIIFCVEGFILKPLNNEAYRLNYYGSGTSYILFTLTDSKIYFCHDTNKRTWNYYLTVQYTKTTDTAASSLTAPGCYDLNRPDLWPENKEIFFGNGLYGYKSTGVASSTAMTINAGITPVPTRIINHEVTISGTNQIPVSSGYWSPNNFISGAYITSQGELCFALSSDYVNKNYTIWVLYNK